MPTKPPAVSAEPVVSTGPIKRTLPKLIICKDAAVRSRAVTSCSLCICTAPPAPWAAPTPPTAIILSSNVTLPTESISISPASPPLPAPSPIPPLVTIADTLTLPASVSIRTSPPAPPANVEPTAAALPVVVIVLSISMAPNVEIKVNAPPF